MKIYKIQRTDTNQFKTAINYNTGWSNTGKIWGRISDLKLHLSYHQQGYTKDDFEYPSKPVISVNNYFGVPTDKVQILEYELGKEGVKVIPLKEYL
jgi:hypothetical protein